MKDQSLLTPASIAGQLKKGWAHLRTRCLTRQRPKAEAPTLVDGILAKPVNHQCEKQVRDRKSRRERNTARMRKAITRTMHETLARQSAEGAKP